MTLTVNVKVETVDDLLDIVDPHNGAGYKLKCLLALRDRVISDTGLSVGCRARLTRTVDVKRDSGWWPYRATLTKGRTGTITEITFSSRTGTMFCQWVPDIEWVTYSWQGQKERWRLRRAKSSFSLPANHLEAVDDL